MKKLVRLLCVASSLLACAALVCAACLRGGRAVHMIRVDRLAAMEKINVLYVAIAEPYKLGTANGKTELSRLVRGGAYYSIDLSEIECSAGAVENSGSVTLTLPEPAIEAFPDPARSIEFRPRTKLFVNDTGLNRIREMYDAVDREKITAAAHAPEYMAMAKAQAEQILRDMLPELHVEIRWK